MPGMILDVLVAFLVKLTLRISRNWGSKNWVPLKANVTRSSVGGGWIFDCPTTEVAYTYAIGGESHTFVDEKPFFLTSSAKAYVARFPEGASAVVRVNSRQPERSVLRAADNYW